MGDSEKPPEADGEWKRTLFILLIIAMIAAAALVSFWLRP
jgi:hypothetical protein